MRRSSFLALLAGAFTFLLFTQMAAEAAPLAGFEQHGERWTYQDGEFRMEGMLLKPSGDGPFPALIVSHGLGGMAQGMMRNMGPKFVEMGFVCIATDYTHYGPAASQSRKQPPVSGLGTGNPPPAAENSARDERPRPREPHPPDFGASPENIRRAVKCIEILESLPYVDAKRIGAYGHSMGAFLTIALAAEAPKRVRAAAITAGGLSARPGFPAPTAEVAMKVRSPFLLLHGSADATVRPEASEALKRILDMEEVPNERHVFEGVKHDINYSRAEDCFRLMRDWFAKHGLLELKK